ncbi:MAG: hypothetical protein QW165_04155 [Candidatus Woesearchaeota archaeon]
MKKEWWLVALLLVPLVSAASISDWPMFFVSNGKFSAKYVVGEEAPALDVVSATIISTSLARYENVTTEVGTSTLDIEIANISNINAIVIGSPCENRAAFQLMGSPEPCYKDLAGSVGYIKLYENNNVKQLLITGLDEKDRHAAAKYLAERDLSHIVAKEYLVPSNSGSVPSFFEQKLKAKNATNVTGQVNVTNITAVQIMATPTPKKVLGPYEPLDEIPKPKKKGWWARFWSWLVGLFT